MEHHTSAYIDRGLFAPQTVPPVENRSAETQGYPDEYTQRRIEFLVNQLEEARVRQSALAVRIGYGDRLAMRCKPAVDKTVNQLVQKLDELDPMEAA